MFDLHACSHRLHTGSRTTVACLAAALAGCAPNADEAPTSSASAESSPSREVVDDPADIHVRDAGEALELLMAGNARFVAGTSLHLHETDARRTLLGGGQHPFGLILGCADSRVPPELVFDVGLGDLFSVRVAGNATGMDETGSIEYALEHLHVPLVLVLGHENCGAVTAALQDHSEESWELRGLLDDLAPGLADIAPDLPLAQQVALGVEANVRHAVSDLRAVQQRIGGEVLEARILGAVYDLESGRVRLLEDVAEGLATEGAPAVAGTL